MHRLAIAIFVIALTAAGAQAMIWDHFRKSANIEDRRGPIEIAAAAVPPASLLFDRRPHMVYTEGRPRLVDAEGRALLVDTKGRPRLVDAEGRPLLADAEGRPRLVDAEPNS